MAELASLVVGAGAMLSGNGRFVSGRASALVSGGSIALARSRREAGRWAGDDEAGGSVDGAGGDDDESGDRGGSGARGTTGGVGGLDGGEGDLAETVGAGGDCCGADGNCGGDGLRTAGGCGACERAAGGFDATGALATDADPGIVTARRQWGHAASVPAIDGVTWNTPEHKGQAIREISLPAETGAGGGAAFELATDCGIETAPRQLGQATAEPAMDGST